MTAARCRNGEAKPLLLLLVVVRHYPGGLFEGFQNSFIAILAKSQAKARAIRFLMKLAEMGPTGKNGAHLLKLLHLVQGAAEENVGHFMGGANLRKFGPAALLSTVGADDHPSFGFEFGYPFLIINTASNKLSDSADPWPITLEANEGLQGFHDWTAEVLIKEQLGI